MKGKRTILIVDDDTSFREVLCENVKRDGFIAIQAGDGRAALDILERADAPTLLLTDIKMPVMDGYELIKRAKYKHPSLPVIAITAHGSIRGAVEAMRLGADNYVTKPFDRKELRAIIAETLKRRPRREEAEDAGGFVFESNAMKEIVEDARRAAGSDATVLITGETGTGKEIVADLIHRGSGRKTFVKINCSAIPGDLLESEFFGHRKGAFTGASYDKKGKFVEADHGSILLDEIGEMKSGLQAKLLRVLEEKTVDVVGGGSVSVDVRVIASTNQSPEDLVKQGIFREDLFYRLNVIRIHVPPLRERQDDIEPLALRFIAAAAGDKKITLAPEVMAALRDYTWPGNVRELKNLCERVVVLRESDDIGLAGLPKHMKAETAPAGPDRGEGMSLGDIEKQIITEALEKSGWNQSAAARSLSIPRHILLYRMEKYGIKTPERKKP